jgi:hypothetical protein
MSTVGLSRSAITPNSGFRITGEVENRRGDFASNVAVHAYLTPESDDYESGFLLGETTLARINGAAIEAFSMRVQAPTPTQLSDLGLSVPSEGYVVAVVDPNRTVPDAQFSNNSASTSVQFVEGCQDDDANTNEGLTTATALGEFTDQASTNGVICAYTEDWYAVELSLPDEMSSMISFSVSLVDFPGSDLDLSVYGSDEQLLASSATENGTESVTLELDPAIHPQVYVRVDGFEDSSSDYRLVWGD